MIFTPDPIQKVKLMFYEKTMMPESKMEEDSKGKKSFVKTGGEVEMTTYTFRDDSGDKIIFLSKENGYRSLEGEYVDITLDIRFNDFTKKVQTKLVSVRKSVQQTI